MPRLHNAVSTTKIVAVYIINSNAPNAALSLELHSRPPDYPVAQPLSLVANGNLHWRQNDSDRISGILGIYVDRASQPLALLEVDRCNGSLHPSGNEEILNVSLNLHPERSEGPLHSLSPSPH